MKLLIIIKKELIDQTRDKRTIVAAILMPAVIVPLLLFMTTYNTSAEGTYPPSGVIIADNDSHIKGVILQSYGDTEFITSDNPHNAILNGKADIFIDYVKSGEQYNSLTLYYDSARSGSMLAYLKFFDIFEKSFNRSQIISDAVKITLVTIRIEK